MSYVVTLQLLGPPPPCSAYSYSTIHATSTPTLALDRATTAVCHTDANEINDQLKLVTKKEGSSPPSTTRLVSRSKRFPYDGTSASQSAATQLACGMAIS
jgi:hypothetical protein